MKRSKIQTAAKVTKMYWSIILPDAISPIPIPPNTGGKEVVDCSVQFHELGRKKQGPSLHGYTLWWFDPGWMPGTPQSHMIIPLHKWTGRENITEGSGVEIRAGRGHPLITVTGKTDST